MGRISTFGQHLYSGRVSFDFVGRRKLWYSISAAIVVLCAVAFVVRGFNMGIEFKGGVEFTAQVQKADAAAVDDMTTAVEESGVTEAGDPIVNTSGSNSVRIQVRALTQDQATTIEKSLTDAGATEVSQNLVGPSWGKQVAQKALTGLGVFLVLVVLFIWAYFREWKMSVAAVVALAHDLLITAGVYAWSGFEVTPATVTGLLTILGYSLYDTVVVFDKVQREHPRHPDVQDAHVRRTGQPGRQPDTGAVDQHVHHGVAPGRGPAVGRRRRAGHRPAQGPRPGPVRGHGGRHVLVHLHRHADGGAAQGPARRRSRPTRPASCPGGGPEPTSVPTGDEPAEPVKVPAATAPSRPLATSGSSKRNQPTRTTRAKRPKGQR